VGPTDQVLADLSAEGDELDGLLVTIEPVQWRAATPAPGWTIAHQVGHLASSNRIAVLAVTDPEAFEARKAELTAGFEQAIDATAAEWASMPADDLLADWRDARSDLADVLGTVEPGQKVPWMVTPVSPASLASVSLMELFGHGQDIRDTVGAPVGASDRLRHVARLGARTRDFAFVMNGLPVPAEEFRVELTAPSGSVRGGPGSSGSGVSPGGAVSPQGGTVWAFGPDQAAQRVTGPAVDFCLLVTRRRHRDDLALAATGADADRWLDIAQAYVGPLSAGREPGQFSSP
jgi:uncharacterized protein (TIGR03084 family)